MTSREARKMRREQERKTAKLARKAALNAPAPPASLEAEFSPELIARARSVGERITAQVASRMQTAPPSAPQPSTHAEEPAAPSRTRAQINRANAQHSTGPRTSQGLSTSSRNALKHGLASGELIIAGEDRAAFEAVLQALLEDHQPASTTEEMLIHEMAQSYWLTQRALRLQNECFTPEGIDEKRLSLFLRYHTTHERAFHKALNTLIRLQKDRRRDANRFVSQRRASTAPEPGFVSQGSTHFAECSPAFSLQLVHECLEKEHATDRAA